MKIKETIRILGPGLLYAGAAVGVSHLVQSTRAGANYGFDLLLILILANLIKYPFFEFGPRYAAATGNNLIEGYRKIGKWAVILFAILTLGTMFTIQAAVTIVTAGLVGNVFSINLSPVSISGIILILITLVLIIGRYSILDKLIKFIIILLALSTVVAVFAASSNGYNPNAEFASGFSWFKHADIVFLIAFIGWMPAPIDITVWHSLWTNAKYKGLKVRPKLKEVLLDFNLGFFGTIILAISFLCLGSLVIHGSGEELSGSGTIFAGQLINMYTSSIGSWAYPAIAIAALTTMLSTTMTCLDAYPRVMIPLTSALFPSIKDRKSKNTERLIWFVVLVIGALILMSVLSSSMRVMVDIATTLSFITAPLLAFLNFRVVTDKHVPWEFQPKKGLKVYAWIGLIFLSGFTLFYLFWSFIF